MRIHELAKELGMASKDLIARLKKLGLSVKGHMSSIDEETVEIVRHELAPKPVAKHEKQKAEKPKAEKPKSEKPKAEKRAPLYKSDQPKPDAEKAPEPTEKKEEKAEPALKIIEVELPLNAKQLAMKVNAKPNDIIKDLMARNVFANVNQNLPDEVVFEITKKYGYEIKKPPTLEEELLKEHREEDHHEVRKNWAIRAPIVTFMGHVDHGKTSLLDYIRKTKITAKEKGGITQHIGAYEVNMGSKGKVTFLDTPGHEAFTAMRARGASATDIVVLVVAANDGVMPQTVEAIDHARAANVPIVVAINKCDLPNISLDKVKKQLAQHELAAEDWGGKTICVPVSAKTGEGVDQLLEMLLLEAELLELRANPDIRARGVVVEGKLSPGQGPVATILVKNGTLKVGDAVLTGIHHGRVKAMISDRGKRIEEAPPATPVEILGLSGVPEAGDEFFVVKDEKKARTLSLLKQEETRVKRLKGGARMSLEELYKHIKDGTVKDLKVILKGDVQGSVEALKSSLEELSTKEVKLNITHMGVGNINESDVMLALVSNAIVLGFHVKVEPKAEELAKKEMVDIKQYEIIYEAIADIKAAMEGMLEPIERESFRGRAQVRQVFSVSKIGNIAGCYVVKGVIPRTSFVRLLRGKEIIFKGKIRSLKHLKDDVKEVREDFECGIALAGHNDVKIGDVIESYVIEKITRRLESS